MSDEMEARILARVRHQFRSDAIAFAGWQVTGPSNVRVATYRVADPVVAGRMRDRGFRVTGADPAVVAERLDEPTDDGGVEMFGRVCLWGAGIVLALTVAVVGWVLFNGGVR